MTGSGQEGDPRPGELSEAERLKRTKRFTTMLQQMLVRDPNAPEVLSAVYFKLEDTPQSPLIEQGICFSAFILALETDPEPIAILADLELFVYAESEGRVSRVVMDRVGGIQRVAIRTIYELHGENATLDNWQRRDK